MLGYIIEAYSGGRYEVELSNPDGSTIAQFRSTLREWGYYGPDDQKPVWLRG